MLANGNDGLAGLSPALEPDRHRGVLLGYRCGCRLENNQPLGCESSSESFGAFGIIGAGIGDHRRWEKTPGHVVDELMISPWEGPK